MEIIEKEKKRREKIVVINGSKIKNNSYKCKSVSSVFVFNFFHNCFLLQLRKHRVQLVVHQVKEQH